MHSVQIDESSDRKTRKWDKKVRRDVI